MTKRSQVRRIESAMWSGGDGLDMVDVLSDTPAPFTRRMSAQMLGTKLTPAVPVSGVDLPCRLFRMGCTESVVDGRTTAGKLTARGRSQSWTHDAVASCRRDRYSAVRHFAEHVCASDRFGVNSAWHTAHTLCLAALRRSACRRL